MRTRFAIATLLLSGVMLLGLTASASGGSKDAPKDAPKDATATTSSAPSATSAQDETMRLDGEKRFRSNCGRCHTAPPKFPPRMMATIVRHMRVRAAITDQDMRLILRYMTE
jgi:mono/diheme cytochrome c family protein